VRLPARAQPASIPLQFASEYKPNPFGLYHFFWTHDSVKKVFVRHRIDRKTMAILPITNPAEILVVEREDLAGYCNEIFKAT